MKKRLIITIVAVALVLSTAIGLSLAYLTDSDSDVNVMTVGKVTVAMDIQQRPASGSELEGFEQRQELMPLVGNVNTAKDDYGMPTRASAQNFIDKIVTVGNTGINGAYVRVLVAVPAALVNVGGVAGNNAVHVLDGTYVDTTNQGLYNDDAQRSTTWGWNKTTLEDTMMINGVEHVVTVYTAKSVLGVGTTADPVIAGVYLDSKVDYDDDSNTWYYGTTALTPDLSEGINIPVYTQAVQMDGFASADAAITAAFRDANGDDINPWATTKFVATADELTAALGDSSVSEIVLTDDITLEADVTVSRSVIIDGNGFEISGKKLIVAANAGTVVVRDVDFKNASAAQPAISATAITGKLAIRRCSFSSTEANSISVTTNGGELMMSDNTFTG